MARGSPSDRHAARVPVPQRSPPPRKSPGRRVLRPKLGVANPAPMLEGRAAALGTTAVVVLRREPGPRPLLRTRHLYLRCGHAAVARWAAMTILLQARVRSPRHGRVRCHARPPRPAGVRCHARPPHLVRVRCCAPRRHARPSTRTLSRATRTTRTSSMDHSAASRWSVLPLLFPLLFLLLLLLRPLHSSLRGEPRRAPVQWTHRAIMLRTRRRAHCLSPGPRRVSRPKGPLLLLLPSLEKHPTQRHRRHRRTRGGRTSERVSRGRKCLKGSQHWSSKSLRPIARPNATTQAAQRPPTAPQRFRGGAVRRGVREGGDGPRTAFQSITTTAARARSRARPRAHPRAHPRGRVHSRPSAALCSSRRHGSRIWRTRSWPDWAAWSQMRGIRWDVAPSLHTVRAYE